MKEGDKDLLYINERGKVSGLVRGYRFGLKGGSGGILGGRIVKGSLCYQPSDNTP
jgi:hypothetical protein